MSEELVGLANAARLFHITDLEMRRWVNHDWVPCTSKEAWPKIPKSYILLVLSFSKGKKPTLDQADRCRLAWLRRHGTPEEQARAREAQEHRYLDIPIAAERLQVSDSLMIHWIREKCVPVIVEGSAPRVPESYIVLVLDFTKNRQPTQSQANLCNLSWLIEHGTPEHQKQARVLLSQFREAGEVWGTKEVASLCGYSRDQVVTWAKNKQIPAVKIDRRLHYLPEDAHTHAAALTRLTAQEAADRLGVSQITVWALAKEGILNSPRNTRGKSFDAEEVERLKIKRDRQQTLQSHEWTSRQIQQELGCSESVVRKLHDCGKLTLLRTIGRVYIYDANEVPELKAQMEKLNPEFEWLSQFVSHKRTYVQNRTARKLGITPGLLRAWNRRRILPFYPGPPINEQRTNRTYPISYINGLANYAGTLPVSLTVAREFAERCRAAGRIIKPGE